jgi:RNA polymerase sigma-70 factor (ECF subfamily)
VTLVEVDVARFRAGDDALFADIVRELSPRLMPLLRRYAGDADPNDLLQDVWVRAYERRATYDGRGSFLGWLLSVTRSVAVDALRARSRVLEGEASPDLPGHHDPDAVFLRTALRDAILDLPERQRDVIVSRLVEGLSTRETAARLECAEGTVKALLHQATRKLRDVLQETLR